MLFNMIKRILFAAWDVQRWQIYLENENWFIRQFIYFIFLAWLLAKK